MTKQARFFFKHWKFCIPAVVGTCFLNVNKGQTLSHNKSALFWTQYFYKLIFSRKRHVSQFIQACITVIKLLSFSALKQFYHQCSRLSATKQLTDNSTTAGPPELIWTWWGRESFLGKISSTCSSAEFRVCNSSWVPNNFVRILPKKFLIHR